MEQPEDARARRRAEARALRGTPERLAAIRAMEEEKTSRARTASAVASGRRTPDNSPDMFGHPWPEWFAMRDAAYDLLCHRATERRTVAYGEIWEAVGAALGKDLGPHWRQLPNLLGYVSERSETELGLLATALVIYDPEDDGSGPGPGFFRLAGSLGLIDPDDVPLEGESWTMSDRQRVYWRDQVEAMFERFAAETD